MYSSDAVHFCRARAIGAVLLLGGTYSTVANAQDYPTWPITIVAPFAAGRPTDVLARNLGVAMGPIGQVADVPMTLVARKSLAPQNLGEFLAFAKANQDKLT